MNYVSALVLIGLSANPSFAQSPQWSISVDAGYTSASLQGDMGKNLFSSDFFDPTDTRKLIVQGPLQSFAPRKGVAGRIQSTYQPSPLPFTRSSELFLGLHVGRVLSQMFEARLGVQTSSGWFVQLYERTGPYVIRPDTNTITYYSDRHGYFDYTSVVIEPSLRMNVLSTPVFVEVGFPVSTMVTTSGYGQQSLVAESPFKIMRKDALLDLIPIQLHTHLGTPVIRVGLHLSIGGRLMLFDFLAADFMFGIRGPVVNANFFSEYSLRENYSWEPRVGVVYLW